MPTRAYAAGFGPEPRHERVDAGAKGVAEHRAEEQRRREDAAHRAGAHGQGRDHETQQEQREHVPRPPGAVEERPDRLAPVADDLGVAERDDAERQPGQRHRDRARQARSREEGRARAQGEEEPGRDHAAQDAQPGVEPDLPRARQRRGQARWKTGSCPKLAQLRSVAAAEATARGAKASRAKLPKMISIVKRAAPRGVL